MHNNLNYLDHKEANVVGYFLFLAKRTIEPSFEMVEVLWRKNFFASSKAANTAGKLAKVLSFVSKILYSNGQAIKTVTV